MRAALASVFTAPRAMLLGAMALTAGAYAPALYGPFVYDDVPHLLENPAMRSPLDLHAVLFSGYQGTRPLYNLTLAASFAVSGLRPFGYHVTSLLLHLSCGALVAALARRLGVGPRAAALAAALFLLHPLQAESVAYINSRSGLLCANLGLAALVVVTASGGGAWRLAAGSLLAVASACSKEAAAVLPALGLIVAWTLRATAPTTDAVATRRAPWQVVAALLPATLLVPVLFTVFPNPHTGNIGGTVPNPMGHLRAEAWALLRLTQMLVVPVGQSVDHLVQRPASWWEARVLLPGLALLALAAVAVAARRRAPMFSFAVAWFFCALAPTNSVIPFVDTLAERHAYLAVAGPAIALAFLLERRAQPGVARGRWAPLAAVACVLALAGATRARALVWSSELRLWADAVENDPGKARPRLNLGYALATSGDLPGALAQFRWARTITPSMPGAFFNEGLTLLHLGRSAEAVRAFRAAIVVAPTDGPPRLELANALQALGRVDEALAVLAEAEARVEDPATRRLSLRRRALLLQRVGRNDEALPLWRRFVALAPRDAGAWNNLGLAALARGDVAEARAALTRAVALAPGQSRFRESLAALPP